MAVYNGARFYKCDLQMQTPADPGHGNWGDLDAIKNPQQVAETYIRRCYEEKLEIIAVTDHNFCSKDFLPHIQKAAKELANDYGYAITIFPGFEFTANVGRGVHVLCLFEPDADLNHIDHILTNCGVPIPRAKNDSHERSSKDLESILSVVQKKNEHGRMQGIVILPHTQSDSGIFDNDKISEWLQQKEYTNPSVFCLEVPKSPSSMSKGWQDLLGNSDSCLPGWKRGRAAACIMSSDAKALDRSATNGIGSRYTWIKMSKPSLESLRQAFLDHESRIRRSDEFPDNPEDGYGHPNIESISIKNAKFLADQEIAFSPCLNTIIGGRGTGKSTIIEYLRIALDRSGEVPERLRENFSGLKDSLKSDSEVTISYKKGKEFETPWTFRSIGANSPAIVTGSEVSNLTAIYVSRENRDTSVSAGPISTMREQVENYRRSTSPRNRDDCGGAT